MMGVPPPEEEILMETVCPSSAPLVVPAIDHPPHALLTKLETFLAALAFRIPEPLLAAGVKALCAVAAAPCPGRIPGIAEAGLAEPMNCAGSIPTMGFIRYLVSFPRGGARAVDFLVLRICPHT